MKLAESVIFGASGLDRAAERRRDAAWIAAALEGGAPVLALWRGKVLVSGDAGGDGPLALAFCPAGTAALAAPGAAAEAPVFLGRDDAGGPLFAVDLSGWTPPEDPEAEIGGFVDRSVQRHPGLPGGTGFVELRQVMTRLSARDAELAATARALLGWHATHRFCARCGAASVPAEAGWQRLCPACGAHHFPRTDPVVIMLVTRGDSLLLGRAPGWPARMYSLLAGFVEPGETVEAAVRREVLEEAGVVVGRVGYLSSQPWPYPASLMIGCHGVAESTGITRAPAELEDARWVGRAEMLEVMAGRHPEIAPGRPGAIARFLIEHWLADRLD